MTNLGRTASTIRNRDVGNDVFFTPAGLVKQLIDETPFHHADLVLDPFRGDGAFFNTFTNPAKDWCEIEDGRDFFEYADPVDWIVSNPPFSLITETMTHSVKIAQQGFAYIMPTYSLTHHRINMAASFGFNLAKVVFFPTPKAWKLGFQMCYAIWTKDTAGIQIQFPQIVTLDLTKGIQTTLI